MMKALVALRDLLIILRDFLMSWDKRKRKQAAREAVDESNKTQSQEPLEEHSSGDSGRPTRHLYKWMRTRKRKDRH